MNHTLSIITFVVSILLIISILFQQSSSSLEGALGGGFGFENIKNTRRGFEQFLFRSTIILSICFIALCIALLS